MLCLLWALIGTLRDQFKAKVEVEFRTGLGCWYRSQAVARSSSPLQWDSHGEMQVMDEGDVVSGRFPWYLQGAHRCFFFSSVGARVFTVHRAVASSRFDVQPEDSGNICWHYTEECCRYQEAELYPTTLGRDPSARPCSADLHPDRPEARGIAVPLTFDTVIGRLPDDPTFEQIENAGGEVRTSIYALRAATIGDIYQVLEERGTGMGIFLGAMLFGLTVAPPIGGNSSLQVMVLQDVLGVWSVILVLVLLAFFFPEAFGKNVFFLLSRPWATCPPSQNFSKPVVRGKDVDEYHTSDSNRHTLIGMFIHYYVLGNAQRIMN
ncbi:hypothetical protein EV363DRAFT_1296461 [Boletus edulis]|nr:hypothetical protein EV363DRAFT_1296461 [Boletus edulis]